MKIVFFSHYSELYGANKSLINLIEGLTLLHNINPIVIVPSDGSIISVLNEKKIPFIIFKFDLWSEVRGELPINPFKYIKNIFLKYKNRNIIKANNIQKLSVLKTKLIGFDPDWIYSNSSVFDFGYLYAKKYKIKHFWHIREFGKKDYNLEFLDRKLVTKSFNSSDRVVAISKSIKFFYLKKYNIKNIVVQHNGVLLLKDFDEINKKSKLKRRLISTKTIFGIVGLLHKNKNQEEAIMAFKLVNDKYPDTKLLIVGLGNQEYLKQKVVDLKITSKVFFLGYLSNPFDAYLEMDVNLMCSRNEGLGRVTIEAMAAGIPTIGYKGGGTIEIIQDNITGVFYENGYEELSKKMIYLIENESKLIEMGDIAKKVFVQNYTSEICAKNIFSLMNDYPN